MKHLSLITTFMLTLGVAHGQDSGFTLDSLIVWELKGKDTTFLSKPFTDKNLIRKYGYDLRFGIIILEEKKALVMKLKYYGADVCFKLGTEIKLLLSNKENIILKNHKDDNCEGIAVVFFSDFFKNKDKIALIQKSNIEAIFIKQDSKNTFIPLNIKQKKDMSRVFNFLAKRI